jgi:Tol biopolymer transport system component
VGVWSPSGNRIIASYAERPQWYPTWFLGTRVFDISNGNLLHEIPDLGAVAWLADESGFLYVSDNGRCLRSFVFDSGTWTDAVCTDEVRLTRHPHSWAQSADGNDLAFTGTRDSTVVAYRLDLSTGRLTDVTSALPVPKGSSPDPLWSSDGRHLFFSYPDGSGGTTYDTQTDTPTAWTTGALSNTVRGYFELHPDGKKAVFLGTQKPRDTSNLEMSVLYQPTGIRPPK